MKQAQMPEDYAVVLQQINEDGSDDFVMLAEALRYDQRRLAHIVASLHHKGLVTISDGRHYGAWLSLSSKGKRLVEYLWPESSLQYGY